MKVVAAIAALAAIALGAYFLIPKAEVGLKAEVEGRVATTVLSSQRDDVWKPPPAREAPPGSKEYRHLTYHFSVLIPEVLTVKEYKEKGTALTVTFQDPRDESKSFQIFVVPYGGKEITDQRVKADVPSGVITEQVSILIDGVEATTFFSKDAILGETREVWFIKGGFLYEVTTYAELDTWLAEIMTTWEFI